MNYPSEEFRDRFAARVHAVLLCALIIGIALWLFRTYGFEPLHFKPGQEAISP